MRYTTLGRFGLLTVLIARNHVQHPTSKPRPSLLFYPFCYLACALLALSGYLKVVESSGLVDFIIPYVLFTLCSCLLINGELFFVKLVGGIAFLTFGIANVISLANDSNSCGCFGSAVIVSPALILAIDLLLCSALLISAWRSRPPDWCISINDVKSLSTGLIMAMGVTAILVSMKSPQIVSIESSKQESVDANFIYMNFNLRNHSAGPVNLDVAWSSCSCVKVKEGQLPLSIGGRGTVPLTIIVKTNSEGKVPKDQFVQLFLRGEDLSRLTLPVTVK